MSPSAARDRERVAAAADYLSVAALAVLGYVLRQRLRTQQNIPLDEIIQSVPLRPALLMAGLDECVDSGWLLSSRRTGNTVYSAAEAPKATPIVWH